MNSLKRPLSNAPFGGHRRGLHFAQFKKAVGGHADAVSRISPSNRGHYSMLSRIISLSGAFQRPVSKGAEDNGTGVGSSKPHNRNTVEKQTLSELTINIFSQNVRGLQRDEYVEESTRWMAQNNAFVTCMQETWKLGDTLEETNSMLIMNHGPKEKLCKRGSLGVAIALSPDARKAWERAGSQRLYFGLRIIATRLRIIDNASRPLMIFLVSAYSPTGAAPQAEREEYAAQLQQCINSCRKGEVLVIGTDANASPGIRSKHDNKYEAGRDQVRGPFGANYQNKAGRELINLLGRNELCLANTFFKKRRYCTWTNPCNKLGHQLDHIIMRQRDLKRTRDAGYYGIPSKDSDHAAVRLRLAIGRNRKRKRVDEESSIKTRIDRGKLKIKEVREEFIHEVKAGFNHPDNIKGKNFLQRLVGSLTGAAKATLSTDARRQPGWYEAAKDIITPAILSRNAAQTIFSATPKAAKAKIKLKEARSLVKKVVRDAERTWYKDKIDGINMFGPKSGTPMHPGRAWEAIKSMRKGKSVTKKIAPMALRKPDGEICSTPEENANVMKDYLSTVFSKTGTYDLSAVAAVRQRDPRKRLWMAKPPTDMETTTAIKKLGNEKSGYDNKCPIEYYKALEQDKEARGYIRTLLDDYWKTGSYPDGPIPDGPPEKIPATQPESEKAQIAKAESATWRISFKANAKKAGTKGAATYAKYAMSTSIKEAMASGARRFELAIDLKKGHMTLHDPLSDYVEYEQEQEEKSDEGGMTFEEWLISRMKLLPKKGDLAACKNWRGICLLDIASKVLASVCVSRMQIVQDDEGLEAQAGFRGKRGTIDGGFSMNMAVQKRKEHGLETWAIFIDLIKAFDTVVRKAAFDVLKKFGFPNHFINIVLRFYKNAIIKFMVGETDSEVASDIGVRQGSIEGPSVFLFIIQAALETMDWPVAKPAFCTKKKGGVTMSERVESKRGVEVFELFMSLFADDCALLFSSRSDLITGSNYLFHQLARFGLNMHIGHGTTASKTEAMYFPARHNKYEDGDTSNFDVSDGFVSFVPEFKYLGSLTHFSTASDTDILARIGYATAAFGAMRSCIFANKDLHLKTKAKIYVTLVVTILLYGSESWAPRQDMLQQLRVFHHGCVRSMCRVTMRQVHKHRITTVSLLERLGLETIEFYYFTRMLRWAGHVARMPWHRTPRKLLTSWVKNKRPRGRPLFTFGHALKKALKWAGLPIQYAEWSTLAQDRPQWRSLITSPTIKTRTPTVDIDSQIIPAGPAPEEATKIIDIAYLIELSQQLK
jgi:exonuclease III